VDQIIKFVVNTEDSKTTFYCLIWQVLAAFEA